MSPPESEARGYHETAYSTSGGCKNTQTPRRPFGQQVTAAARWSSTEGCALLSLDPEAAPELAAEELHCPPEEE